MRWALSRATLEQEHCKEITVMTRRYGQRLCLNISAIALIACNSTSEPAASEATPMTRERCEAQSGFAFVPAGAFLSGSDAAERDYGYQISAAAADPTDQRAAEQRLRDRRWFDREPDRQSQQLEAFCIGTHLVTQADYAAFVAATGHRAPGISAAEYQAQGFLVHPYEDTAPYQWQDKQPPADKLNHPVVMVSYDDALAYGAWRGEQDGVAYRLPTALEWEKAARGPEGNYFPWGNTWQDDATNWAQQGDYSTSEIGAYPLSRSIYGVEDMAGNVFEYTATLLEHQGISVSVMKGCSWDDLPGFCRAAYRHTRPIDSRHLLFGFRLVLE
jgi:formylglycine-generating enzyme required for sulfatase activity